MLKRNLEGGDPENVKKKKKETGLLSRDFANLLSFILILQFIPKMYGIPNYYEKYKVVYIMQNDMLEGG